MTWGNEAHGGDSSAAQDLLTNVQQIQASSNAFAAILGDGSVVTWGEAGFGGDSRFCAASAQECAADPSHQIRNGCGFCGHSW